MVTRFLSAVSEEMFFRVRLYGRFREQKKNLCAEWYRKFREQTQKLIKIPRSLGWSRVDLRILDSSIRRGI